MRIPEGCLLLQAGKQMEWLTGGAVKAGYHEASQSCLGAGAGVVGAGAGRERTEVQGCSCMPSEVVRLRPSAIAPPPPPSTLTGHLH